jgi:hypothetical protein
VNRHLVVTCLAVALLGACARSTTPVHRFELRRISGDTVQIVPAAGQMQYCLVFTQSAKGLVRQLTISKNNTSVHCATGEPVLGQTYRIPAEEGPVKIHVFFSDQRLEAASVANQLNEMSTVNFNPINFRLPGNVIVDTVDFTPSETNEPAPGKLVPGPAPKSEQSRAG